jgi:hypothetical protein
MSLKSKRILLSAEANGVRWPKLLAINALCTKYISIKGEVEAPIFLGNTVTGLGRCGPLMM